MWQNFSICKILYHSIYLYYNPLIDPTKYLNLPIYWNEHGQHFWIYTAILVKVSVVLMPNKWASSMGFLHHKLKHKQQRIPEYLIFLFICLRLMCYLIDINAPLLNNGKSRRLLIMPVQFRIFSGIYLHKSKYTLT